MDAPVSGGVNAAAGGTLTFMVGAATEENFKQAEQILQNMGAKVICVPAALEHVFVGEMYIFYLP